MAATLLGVLSDKYERLKDALAAACDRLDEHINTAEAVFDASDLLDPLRPEGTLPTAFEAVPAETLRALAADLSAIHRSLAALASPIATGRELRSTDG